MLTLLRREFVNCWVLAKDLEAIAARDGSPEVTTLSKRIRENYGYPVDSVLLAADLRVLGHANAHDPVARDPAAYLAFLRAGLTAAGRTPLAAEPATLPSTADAAPRGCELKVTPDQPSTSVLDMVSRRGFGQPSLAYYPIDASAFADGGVLEIEIRVGRPTAAATFELCAAMARTPAEVEAGLHGKVFRPVQTATVEKGGTAKFVYAFEKDASFGLAARTADGSIEGDSNAFLAVLTVRH